MIQAGQRIRVYGGRVAHLVTSHLTVLGRDDLTLALFACGNRVYASGPAAPDLYPDPTLPLCATCARRKDTT